ncbi:acetyl-CoA carboxylase biotin carboxyl carrier protein subunit [Caballeronia ptereochthonis]|uniref:Biotin carboxyl carrier protein of acetyl-CoA carboxylase n=2 Tax=Caballeronia ptereochthonis TaxID=1777144 RepID=A0A158DAQ6_9BURK|nr:acetyl-CoA carboxylase biotin carboxyl carrier protein subunit [Caballeronia ptereochthonis]
MDLQRIKALIDLLAQSPLAEIELIEGEDRVRLVKTLGAKVRAEEAAQEAERPERAEAPETSGQSEKPQPSQPESHTLHAPMFGVVHLTPAPADPPFARLGDTIAEGQVLCAIEAMKMFNAIESDCAGTLVEVLVAAGDEVQSGQPLFRIAPRRQNDHV